MTTPTLTLRKTRTAADYVHTHTRSVHARAGATAVLRALAGVHAADPDAAVTLRDLITAVADCAGSDWLQAHADDPDVRRLTQYLDTPALVPSDPADLDDLLATVLWARHGPEPAAT